MAALTRVAAVPMMPGMTTGPTSVALEFDPARLDAFPRSALPGRTDASFAASP